MHQIKLLRLPISYFLFSIFFLFSNNASANFDFNTNCQKAYQNIFELKLNAARQLIAAEKKIHPNNSIVPFLENYVDYYYLLTTESKSEFERLEPNKEVRLDQISDDDKSSPYYLYAQAQINIQWALMRGRFGSYLTVAREINRANSLLQENTKKFPGFHLNGIGLGLINAVLGVLPDGFLKSTLSTFGIKGNLQAGLNMLDKLAENLPKSAYEPFYEETVFTYAYVLSDVAKSPSAYAKTMKYMARIPDTSLLKCYLQAYVCARNGHTDVAITTLANRPTGAVYQPFPYLDYLMGIAKLNKLDYSAEASFEKFLQTNKGVNNIKDAYLHLAWIALLKGENNNLSALIAKTKASGFIFAERDKQALNEANSPTPNKELLKARLLFDGGYFAKGLDVLSDSKAEDYASAKDKTEYHYRLGRLNDALGKDDMALMNYQNAITVGKSLKYYFAAKSAVQIGIIYEAKKNTQKAKSSFNLAISMKGHEQENSIENEAKQGLRRIGG
ncbi:tetratricopeptide repeat protein [Pedobacter frigiditerrae]|uniref:Tetratricopeptide repeat protein n=1 Tax=Pedobacter frigiditerrae TaxID=2530452 RepID=A0A4R0N1R2_9SPHI|nr:tetratricopeptide repeat protein [Pedobacter frigiditerrae]TCC93749.1 tetratricopeptide repeat protein [Pedobacter frigiditerrae]